jgi:hypothetical protein
MYDVKDVKDKRGGYIRIYIFIEPSSFSDFLGRLALHTHTHTQYIYTRFIFHIFHRSANLLQHKNL